MTAQQLKNSILQMAVQGKLVPQDPNDEPASVLLQRIRAEKQELIKAGKIKKDKKSSEIFRGASRNLPYAFCEQIGKEIRDISDEIPFDIPDSWEWCRLGAIFQHNTGKALNSSNHQGTKMTYITTSNLYWDRFELDKLKEMPFTDSEVEKCTVKKGDLLVCEGGDIGRAAIWSYDYPMRIQNHIHRLRSYLEVDVYYFYYIFFLYKGAGLIGGKGIGIQGLSSNAIDKLLLPVPPLAEQHRIVAKIEELIPYIEKYGKAEDHLTTLNTTFPEALKKSILQEAVQGKLVPQNPNDEPASVLLERIRAEKQALIKAGKIKKEKHESVIVTRDKIPYEIIDGKERCIADEVPFELPESWCWCRLNDIITGIETGKSLKCIETPPEKNEVGIIKVSAVSWGDFNENESKTCLSSDSWNELYSIREKDFLISRANTTELVGACVIVNSISKRLMLSDKTLRIVFCSDVYKEYILFVMRSSSLRNQIEQSASGTSSSMKNISQDAIRHLLIPIPPIEEQHRIVSQIEEILPIVNTITK